MESVYSNNENRTRGPVGPSPVLHPSSGGSQGGLGREVCGCSAAGGTRPGCVRGTLGAICFIARLPPWSPYCALPPGPRSPSMLHPYLSRRAPLPYLGSGPWRLLRIQVCVRALLARWSGARLCSGEVGPGGLPRDGYRGRVPAGYPTSLAYTVVPSAAAWSVPRLLCFISPHSA